MSGPPMGRRTAAMLLRPRLCRGLPVRRRRGVPPQPSPQSARQPTSLWQVGRTGRSGGHGTGGRRRAERERGIETQTHTPQTHNTRYNLNFLD